MNAIFEANALARVACDELVRDMMLVAQEPLALKTVTDGLGLTPYSANPLEDGLEPAGEV